MRLRLLLSVSVLGLAAVTGCSGDTESGGGGAAVGIPLDQLAPPYTEAQCAAIQRCFGPVYELFLPGEDCQIVGERGFQDALTTLQKAIDAGTVTYDGTRAQACIDSIEAQGCELLDGVETPECEAVIQGTIATGSDCATSAECVGNAFCSYTNACPGTCTSARQENESCTDEAECDAGLDCISGTCRKLVQSGGSCGGADGLTCAAGLFCLGADDTRSGTCTPFAQAFAGKEGDSCAFDGTLCDASLSCALDTFMPMGNSTFKCEAKVSPGATCKFAVPDQCPTGEYCDIPMNMIEGTCTPLPGAGQPCVTDSLDETVCAPNLRCDGGTCSERKNLGGSCSDDDVCYSEFCNGGRCQDRNSCE